MESILFLFVLPLSLSLSGLAPMLLQWPVKQSLFPSCPDTAFLSVQPKGSFLDHKLNVTLLLKICHPLSALEVAFESLPIVYKEIFCRICHLPASQADLLSHTLEHAECFPNHLLHSTAGISCFTLALGLDATLKSPLGPPPSNITLPCIYFMILTHHV